MHPGERIRDFREKRGLNQPDFAKSISYSNGYLAEIELGKKKPSRRFAEKLFEVYGLSTDYILYGIKQNISPHIVEDVPIEYGIAGAFQERRLPKNNKKRSLINNVIKILDSGDKKIIRTLIFNIDAFLVVVESKEPEIKEGD